MGHLYKFNLLQVMREKGDMFWSLLFPIILGALFYLSFGTSGTETMMAPVSVAVVKEGNLIFESFLQQMDGNTILLQEMEEEQATEALREGNVDGIFYSTRTPSLKVRSVDINASILNMLLKAYVENQTMLEEIGEENILRLPPAILSMMDYRELTSSVNMSGNASNDTLSYYFALVAMACLFGAFMGMTSASQLRADQSALAARRSIAPVHRFKLVLSEMMAVFTVQFFNICVLLFYLHFVLRISFGEKWALLIPVCILGSMAGVAIGIFIGSTKLGEGAKTGLLVGGSLFMSFLSGLMYGNMKDVVEHYFPLLNRINPAALIADAFYSVTIYDNPVRYRRNLVLLAVITILLVLISYRRLRRERYDSL